MEENCFVYENVVVKPFAQLGRDVIVETGSVVGHHTEIHDHCFLGPHSVVLGECTIEPFCIIGANAVVREHVRVASGCIIGAGALITRDTRPGGVYLGSRLRDAAGIQRRAERAPGSPLNQPDGRSGRGATPFGSRKNSRPC